MFIFQVLVLVQGGVCSDAELLGDPEPSLTSIYEAVLCRKWWFFPLASSRGFLRVKRVNEFGVARWFASLRARRSSGGSGSDVLRFARRSGGAETDEARGASARPPFFTLDGFRTKAETYKHRWPQTTWTPPANTTLLLSSWVVVRLRAGPSGETIGAFFISLKLFFCFVSTLNDLSKDRKTFYAEHKTNGLKHLET